MVNLSILTIKEFWEEKKKIYKLDQAYYKYKLNEDKWSSFRFHCRRRLRGFHLFFC